MAPKKSQPWYYTTPGIGHVVALWTFVIPTVWGLIQQSVSRRRRRH